MFRAVCLVIIICNLILPADALAQNPGFTPDIPSTQKDKKKPETCPPGYTCLDNPLKVKDENINPNTMIGNIVNAVMGIVGSIAFGFFIYGGFIMMIAAGNSEQIQKGKMIIFWAVVGTIFIFTAYAAAKFVIKGVVN